MFNVCQVKKLTPFNREAEGEEAISLQGQSRRGEGATVCVAWACGGTLTSLALVSPSFIICPTVKGATAVESRDWEGLWIQKKRSFWPWTWNIMKRLKGLSRSSESMSECLRSANSYLRIAVQ